jgi:hypothetical protein
MTAARWPLVKLVIVLGTTAVLVALVWAHVAGMNGPYYWKWHWRRLEVWPLVIPIALAAIPFFLGQWFFVSRRRVDLALVLVTISTLLLQFAAISGQPPGGISRATYLIRNPLATSYFVDAQVPHYNKIPLRGWIDDYPRLLPRLHLHSRYKPPGPILFHLFFLDLFARDESAALAADAFAIALLAAAAVPMCFGLIKTLSGDTAAAFCAASYFAVCPSLVLMFPQLDQVYATMSCFLLMAWGLALLRKSVAWSIAFGLALGVASFTSYIFLGLGVFLAIYTLLFVADRGRAGLKTAVICSSLALATLLAFYGLLQLAFGFDPIETFSAISRLQMKGIVWIGRPFPRHLVFDMLDFLLGAGWLSGVLVVFFILRSRANKPRDDVRRLAWLALVQIGTLWLAALLPGESARLWLPFMPLLMIPVGIELAEWPARWRAVVYGCVLVLTLSVCRNMIFVYAGRQVDGLRPYYLPFQSTADQARMESIDPDPPQGR